MKQKLLTLLVLLVSTMCAFAQSDATGEGIAYDDNGKQPVKYSYIFTESFGTVTMTVTAENESGADVSANTSFADWTSGNLDETYKNPRVWEGLEVGTTLKLKLWWAVNPGRANTADYITYVVKGSTAKDEEAPVWAKAETTNIKDTKATLVLNATDNAKGTLTYTVKNGDVTVATVTGKQGTDVNAEIDGLTAETAYTLTITAKDATGNESEAKTVTFTTAKAFTLTAPTAPTVAADKVMSVLSGYDPATTFNFGGWGQQCAYEQLTVDGQPVLHVSNFDYLGLEYATPLDLSKMNTLHLDVLPRSMSGNFQVTPIMQGGTPTEAVKNAGTPSTWTLDQWNSVDIPLSTFGLDIINYKSHQIKFVVDPQNKTDEFYIANVYFYNNYEGEAFLSSISVDNNLVVGVKTVTTTATLLASDNTAFDGDVTYTISDGATVTAEGKTLTITAENYGVYTLTAASGEHMTTTKVAFVGPGDQPTAEAGKVLSYYSDAYDSFITNFKGYIWEWNWKSVDEVNLADDDKAILVKGVGTWGVNGEGKDLSAYNKLVTDVFAVEESPIEVVMEGLPGNPSVYKGNLTTGWNHIEMDLQNYTRTAATWVKFRIGTENKHDYTCLFDNIYAVAADIAFNVTTADNVAKVVGDVTADNVEEINKADAMTIDLSSISSIAADATIKPLHKNAVIVVPGTWDGGTKTCTIDDKYEPLKSVNNLVVLNTWYFPYKKLEFVDEPGEPLYMCEGLSQGFISSETIGWNLTRTIKAKSFATVCLPLAITNIPEGLSVWEAVDYDATKGVSFNKANVIGGNFPYVVYNSTDNDIDLIESGDGNINFNQWVGNTAEKKQIGATSAYFCGNWAEALDTDGNQWIVKNDNTSAVIKQANGAKISPFRAYFTGLDAANGEAKLNFNGDEALGINGINATDAAADGAIYNLAGQKVNAAYKGIVIKNGKKYIVK